MNKYTILIDGDKNLFDEILGNLENYFSILSNKNKLSELFQMRETNMQQEQESEENNIRQNEEILKEGIDVIRKNSYNLNKMTKSVQD